jgi:anti-anti-sigma factor
MKRHPAMAADIRPGSQGESPESLATQISAGRPPNKTEPYLEMTAGVLRVRPLVHQRPAGKRLRAAHTLLLSGSLDRSSTHTLEAEIERLCESGVCEITLDLAQLAGIDPAGVAVIVFRRKWCAKRGCDLSLARCTPDTRVAFEAAGAGELLGNEPGDASVDAPDAPDPVAAAIERPGPRIIAAAARARDATARIIAAATRPDGTGTRIVARRADDDARPASAPDTGATTTPIEEAGAAAV